MNIITLSHFKGIILRFSRILWREIRINTYGQSFPLKPTTLNLLVNDICNSRCQMCLIWKNKKDREFTPKELKHILNDPLFKKLKYVGVSGGEPTLRDDLPEIFQVISQKKPKIQGTGIISNAINYDQALQRILSSAEPALEAGIPFNVMISLDGIGEVHDRIRGREGNFETAVEILRYIRDETNIPVSVGCTITKDNVWSVDEVLDWCISEGIYARFRIAEFIDRLYNDPQVEYIRNFSELERYQLALFFAKLESTYEASVQVKGTYRNIRSMVLNHAPRSIACPYQSNAIVLDCRGNLLYCSPKSPVLGNTLESEAQAIYQSNLHLRNEIINSECKDCIHDYHAEESLKEFSEVIRKYIWRRRLSLRSSLRASKSLPKLKGTSILTKNPSQVLIVGWFGTETAGDKAVLAEALRDLSKLDSVSITIASTNPFLTRQTIREVGFPDVKVVFTYSSAFWKLTAQADEIHMVGGPLMHIEDLGIILSSFLRAKLNGHRTVIYGCGIGPLDAGPEYEEAVIRILQLSDQVNLRDANSIDWAKESTGRSAIANVGDPASLYVKRWISSSGSIDPKPYLNLYLRNWTEEYRGDLEIDSFYEVKTRFEEMLSEWIMDSCEEYSLQPRFLPMNYFWAGNDDREFNRSFVRNYLSSMDVIIENRPLSLDQILETMMEGTFLMCMRYHSVVFAHNLGVPFIAIDYSQGGKIQSYLSEHNQLGKMCTPTQIASGERLRIE